MEFILNKYNKLIDFLKPSAVKFSNDYTVQFRSQSFINFMVLLMIVLVVYSLLHFLLGIYEVATLMGIVFFAMLVCLNYFRKTGHLYFSVNVAFFIGWMAVSISSYYNGLYNSQAIAWYIVIAFTSIQMVTMRNSLVWTGIIVMTYLGLYFLSLIEYPTVDLYGEYLTKHFRFQNFIYIMLIGVLIVYFYTVQRERMVEIVEHKNKDLEKKDIKLNQQLDNNKNLLRVISHDMGTPLQSLQFGLSRVNKMCVEEQKVYIQRMQASIDAMGDMVHHAQALSEAFDNNFNIQLSLVNLCDVLSKEMEILNHKLNEKNIELIVDIPDELKECLVVAEKVSVQNEVIGNILTNAIKFSDPGSKIFIKTFKEKSRIVLSIRDQGVGMSISMIESILKANKQHSRSGTVGEKGSGYGMVLMRRYLELYNAELKIASRIKTVESSESGTEFIISFCYE